MERPPPRPRLGGLGLHSLTTWAHLPRLRRTVPSSTSKGDGARFQRLPLVQVPLTGCSPLPAGFLSPCANKLNPSWCHGLDFCGVHRHGGLLFLSHSPLSTPFTLPKAALHPSNLQPPTQHPPSLHPPPVRKHTPRSVRPDPGSRPLLHLEFLYFAL